MQTPPSQGRPPPGPSGAGGPAPTVSPDLSSAAAPYSEIEPLLPRAGSYGAGAGGGAGGGAAGGGRGAAVEPPAGPPPPLQPPARATFAMAAPAGAGAPGRVGGPHAAGYWARAKAKAQAQMSEVRREAAGNVAAVREAAQEVVAADASLRQRLRAAAGLVAAVDSGPLAKWGARGLVCAFYVNQAAEAIETWAHLKDSPVRRRWASDPEPPPLAFPWIQVSLWLPLALLCLLGLGVPLTGGALLAKTVWEEAAITWRQIVTVIWYGSRPTEMLAKRLAIVGSTLLVVAHSAKDRARMRSYAGMLLSPDRPSSGPSRRRSAALLAGRLLLACLLLFAGWSQLRRIAHRGGSLWTATPLTPRQQADQAVRQAAAVLSSASDAAAAKAAGGATDAGGAAAVGPRSTGGAAGGGTAGGYGFVRHHYGIPDSHDNNWQLLELALCLPLVLGWQTSLVCRLLAGVLLLEAVTCWPFWAWFWPSWHAAAHARQHFFVDGAVAGGLVLLQALGPGSYTVDRLLSGKAE
ncbi:hypothetical protein HYH03_007692 [Edaphochlamys debaryana]|uniref:Uncharacterized protein n=1 Tax=Edaphochlamys debaryana TaxID=47281 RepID=A0A835Y4L3_9CHLO|nr:hypothetical protein HYH03_007692 [Edaphochlamys debaryana]|eukprot:KAG2494046.1 hypothetical protein HYH03_007692 [Edaphochlamys debaryana]